MLSSEWAVFEFQDRYNKPDSATPPVLKRYSISFLDKNNNFVFKQTSLYIFVIIRLIYFM